MIWDVVNQYRYPVRLCYKPAFQMLNLPNFSVFQPNVCFENNDKTSNLSELNESLTISTSDIAINVLFLKKWKQFTKCLSFHCYFSHMELTLMFLHNTTIKYGFPPRGRRMISLQKNQHSRKVRNLSLSLIFLLFLI